jgi:hypothetical protein
MTLGFARRGAVRAMLALVAMCVMSPGWLESANAGNRFSIKGRAAGLIPGIPEDLVISIRNPYSFAIIVHGVEVVPESASDNCRAANISSPGVTDDVRVKPESTLKVTVPITLRSKAPRGCAGASFPLSFDAMATRP